MNEKIKPTNPSKEIMELRIPSSISILLKLPLSKLFRSNLKMYVENAKQRIPSKIEVMEICTPPISKPMRKFLKLWSIMSTDTPHSESSTNPQAISQIGLNISANQNSVLTNVRLAIRKLRRQKLNRKIW